MCVSISATVALACLFAPKIYIVLCQPQKNTRNVTSTSIHSSTGGAIAKSSRPFFAPAAAHKLEPRMTAQNGSVVGSEDSKPPEVAFTDSIDDTSCDEAVAMAKTPTWLSLKRRSEFSESKTKYNIITKFNQRNT